MAQPHIVMVFIGESGSGKSTCINYFANFFTNSSFDQLNHYSNMKIVIPNNLFPDTNFICGTNGHSERNVQDNSVSQTQECSVYDFHWNQKYVKVVDTPGFNDTDASKDDPNIQKILKKASELPFITAILITINGTNVRLSTSIRTTLSQLRGSLPDCVFQNIFFIFTNCTEETRNFNLKLLKEFGPATERTFHMQNSLFSIRDMSVLTNEKLVRRMVQTWDECVETMGELMSRVQQTSATSAQVFVDMRIRRGRLVANKENLIARQKSLLDIMNQLEIEKMRLNNATNNQQANKDYIVKKNISVIEMETKPYYSTLCTSHYTVQVCHERCSLSYEPNLNLAHFARCAAADGRNCRHCKCGMNQHSHSCVIPVSRMKTVDEIVQSKKAAYDTATIAIQSSTNRTSQLNISRNACQNEVNSIKYILLTTIRELKQICSHFNFPEEMKNTIQNLRKEAMIAQDIHAKQEFNNTADAIEQLINQLR